MTDKDIPDLMNAEVQQQPYAVYRELQTQCPVYKMPSNDVCLLVNDQYAREVLRQPDVFLSGVNPMALADGGSVDQDIIDIYQNEGWLPLSSCSTTDLPRHRKVRRFLETLFTAERVRQATPMIDQAAAELLDTLSTHTNIAFVQAFAHPFPMVAIAHLLGVPTTDIAQFKRWSDAIVEPFSMMASRQRRIECARLVVDMQHYFAAMITERRKKPGDDFISDALAYRDEHGEAFDMQELMTLITIDLLASGNETTTAAIGSGMKLLLEDRAVMAAVSQNPALVTTFIEEVLRVESPVQGMFRQCSQITDVGGVALQAGDLLNIRFGAANRDETRYPNAARIDLTRKKPGGHLAFGMGRHVCVGAALARQEMISAFRLLFTRYRAFDWVPDTPEPCYQPSFFGRNLDELHVRLLPR